MIENFQNNSVIKLNAKITTILLLNNKKDIAVCTTNGYLHIFNIKIFKLVLSIELMKSIEHSLKKTILDIIEFSKNKFCLACWDDTIKVIELYDKNRKYKLLQTLPDHKAFVNSLKKLSFFKNEIIVASSSSNGIIILWKYENEKFNKFREIKLYSNDPDQEDIYNRQIESMEESSKYHKLICGNFHSNTLFFCDLIDTQIIGRKEMNVNRCIRALKIIENGEILLVVGNSEINVIELEKFEILITIKYGLSCEFNCVFQKKNGNILITEYGKICKIKEFQFDLKKLALNVISMRENDFSNYITTIVELDNENLIIGGYDQTIKFFQKLKVK